MAERGSNDKSNKTLRAYLVYDYIFKKSESDYFAVSSINAYLQTYGINCDNRAIVRDIEAINQAVVILENELDDVEAANEALEKEANQFIIRDDLGRYHINREHFMLNDIAMIAECISAARFINAAETERLIEVLGRSLNPKDVEKVKAVVTNVQREKTRSSLFYDNFFKLNEMVSDVIERDALGKVGFEYLTYDIDFLGKPLEKQNKEEYIVYPHKIINSNGLYYLVAYDETKRKMRFFRVDRMRKIQAYYDEKHSGKRLAEKMDFPTLTARTFDMCIGESTRVTIRFANTLFDTVFERFGTDGVSYHKCDDKYFEIVLTLDVSPKFFGWLCGFGNDAKLVSPPSVVKEFASYLDEIKSQY